MLNFGNHRLGRKDIFICLIGMMICFSLGNYKNKITQPDIFDSREYIGAAYNLYHHGVQNDLASRLKPESTVGREPLYSWVLSLFFVADDKWQAITPECIQTGCDASIYQGAVDLNFIFVSLSGMIMYLFLFHLTKNRLVAIIAGFHIWLNLSLYKSFGQLISDPLALFLTSCLCVSIYFMLMRKQLILALISGGLYGLLILDKAIFLYSLPIFVFILFIYLALNKEIARRVKVGLMAVFLIASILPVYSWMERNQSVNGHFSLTEGRTGIALHAREIYNDMYQEEYFASFIYWTRGFGDNLAQKLFPQKYWEKFNLDNPDGYYLKGHNGFAISMEKLKNQNQDLSNEEIKEQAISDIKGKILSQPFKHIAVSLPLFYRGLQFDFFIFLSLPAIIFFVIYLLQTRRDLFIYFLTFIPSLFTIAIHPLVSISIPRYFIPAMPFLSFATAIMLIYLWKNRSLKIKKSSI